MTQVGLINCVPVDQNGDNFKCRVCGVECPIAPQLPELPVCEKHCPDHEYRHEGSEGKRCIHCFAEEPWDWK